MIEPWRCLRCCRQSGWHVACSKQPSAVAHAACTSFCTSMHLTLQPRPRAFAPTQEIALIDPLTLPRDSEAGTAASSAAPSAASSRAQTPQDAASQQAQQGSAAAGGGSPLGPGFPQLPPVATRPRPPADADPLGAQTASDTPQQCVLLRAGGIMSKLDMQEGSEVLLSDAIERFWLPISPAAAGVDAPTVGGGSASVSVSRTASFLVGPGSGSSAAEGGGGAGSGGPSLSTSSSMAGLARNTSDAELPGAVAAAAAAQLAAAGEGRESGQSGQPPRVEMPWWTYGARGMQVGATGRQPCGSTPAQASLQGQACPVLPGLHSRALECCTLAALLWAAVETQHTSLAASARLTGPLLAPPPPFPTALVPFFPVRAAHPLPAVPGQPNRHGPGGRSGGGGHQLHGSGETSRFYAALFYFMLA